MTKYTLAIAASLFATTAIADGFYFGLADGNPDLYSGHPTQEQHTDDRVGVQPGVGDRTEFYFGLADGNSDLVSHLKATGDSGSRPDIYQGFGGSSDLSY